MSDQVKYTQKLQGAKILITGGSAGKFHFHSIPFPITKYIPRSKKKPPTDMSSLLFFSPNKN